MKGCSKYVENSLEDESKFYSSDAKRAKKIN